MTVAQQPKVLEFRLGGKGLKPKVRKYEKRAGFFEESNDNQQHRTGRLLTSEFR